MTRKVSVPSHDGTHMHTFVWEGPANVAHPEPPSDAVCSAGCGKTLKDHKDGR